MVFKQIHKKRRKRDIKKNFAKGNVALVTNEQQLYSETERLTLRPLDTSDYEKWVEGVLMVPFLNNINTIVLK